ncbi:hypothetical protein ACVDG3_18610 [Meridianimarinicoccus sp. RP-17]|uniref:hypothetical protein n=1 Tax=Meridianimarinicoccus zhengii TaxID=2056810 RepID=UPI000DAF4275|nr:hypothetical protein [Phycocomes zhengii]
MTFDIEVRRRALFLFYDRYIRAERSLRLAQRGARAFFPEGARPSVVLIGNPGSRMRRLSDQRDRRLAQLTLAHQRFHEARRRAAGVVRLPAPPGH